MEVRPVHLFTRRSDPMSTRRSDPPPVYAEVRPMYTQRTDSPVYAEVRPPVYVEVRLTL